MNLKELKKEIPYKWKVQTAKEWGCDCVAYIDARDVMDMLDEVVGPENWQDRYEQVDNSLFCHLSIRVGDEWITKSDCGMPSNVEAEKGEASDAFKRVAVKWGIGRFLYSLRTVKIKETICTNPAEPNPKYKKYVPVYNGKRIYDMTAHIIQNNLYQPKGAPAGKQPEQKTGYTPKPKATHAPEPKAEPKAVQPPTPKADAADSQGMSTIGQREEIQELCAEKNSGGKKFQDLLKEQNFTWAKLTYSQAETVISILKAK